MDHEEIIAWLLDGDPSIQYQTCRDLLGKSKPELQDLIARQSWGKRFLDQRQPNGFWGESYYQPKWISTHYTLLDLRNLNISQAIQPIRDSIDMILDTHIAEDGGIRLGPSTSQRSDVCVNGMFLNFASYFQTPEKHLQSVVNALLGELMPDGGFNCRTTRSGATHSSLHSTISVLEGFETYVQAGHSYRLEEVKRAQATAQEFILLHKLFLSDRTGEMIHKDFLKLSYPGRWKYDILRALDYFQFAKASWDERMEPAIQVILAKRNRIGTWNMQAAHPGKQHFSMEKASTPSRWNTLRAMRVLEHFGIDRNEEQCLSNNTSLR